MNITNGKNKKREIKFPLFIAYKKNSIINKERLIKMSEFVEYNCDTKPYPSFGKKYNGEKAIISLTSWKARINTVSKTLFSLLQQCPGFHIVLVLSEEEFLKMMNELPENLKLFVDNELIEVLWVYKNYKSFKKVLFTMDKYRDVPVISADDDCIYTCNYAQMLYDKWKDNKKSFVTIKSDRPFYKKITCNGIGAASLHPPKIYENFLPLLNFKELTNISHDDIFYMIIRNKLKTPQQIVNKRIKDIIKFVNECKPLHNTYVKINAKSLYETAIDKFIKGI